jgi:hypothetical protein
VEQSFVSDASLNLSSLFAAEEYVTHRIGERWLSVSLLSQFRSGLGQLEELGRERVKHSQPYTDRDRDGRAYTCALCGVVDARWPQRSAS